MSLPGDVVLVGSQESLLELVSIIHCGNYELNLCKTTLEVQSPDKVHALSEVGGHQNSGRSTFRIIARTLPSKDHLEFRISVVPTVFELRILSSGFVPVDLRAPQHIEQNAVNDVSKCLIESQSRLTAPMLRKASRALSSGSCGNMVLALLDR